MKRILVFIMVVLVALQSFGKWLILLEYRVNQEYIARVLCENKARPQLKCKGKCQLMKKLAAEEKQSGSQAGSNQKADAADVLFTPENTGDKMEPVMALLPKANTRYLVRDYTAPATGIFHPPLQG